MFCLPLFLFINPLFRSFHLFISVNCLLKYHKSFDEYIYLNISKSSNDSAFSDSISVAYSKKCLVGHIQPSSLSVHPTSEIMHASSQYRRSAVFSIKGGRLEMESLLSYSAAK